MTIEKPPSTSESKDSQIDYQRIIDAVVKEVGASLDNRVSGLQSSFQTMLNKAMVDMQPGDANAPDSGSDSKPFSTLSPADRAARLRADGLALRELELDRRELATQYDVDATKLFGNTKEALEIAAVKIHLADVEAKAAESKPVETETKESVTKEVAQSGNPPGGSNREGMTPRQLILSGLNSESN